MPRKKVTARGDNLIKARAVNFKDAKAAVKAMHDHGFNINYRRYLALEDGKIPKNHNEFKAIQKTIGISLEAWMLGEESEDTGCCCALCDTFEGLPPNIRKIIMSMSRAGVEAAKGLCFK